MEDCNRDFILSSDCTKDIILSLKKQVICRFMRCLSCVLLFILYININIYIYSSVLRVVGCSLTPGQWSRKQGICGGEEGIVFCSFGFTFYFF